VAGEKFNNAGANSTLLKFILNNLNDYYRVDSFSYKTEF
jgi:hypothetical protein